MFKLMKYEFRKQALSKLIILVLAAITEIIFLFGIFTNKTEQMAVGFGLFCMLAFAAVFYVAFESIGVYSKDLKTKNSYMLFLTPNTSFSIVGAKVLSTGIQILVTGLVFLGIFILDIVIVLIRVEEISKIKDFVQELFNLASDKVLVTNLVWFFVFMLLSWVFVTIMAFFSITLSTTVLANSKLKGILSFAIFMGITYLVSKIAQLLSLDQFLNMDQATLMLSNMKLIAYSLYLISVSALAYVGTALLLEKKVNL